MDYYGEVDRYKPSNLLYTQERLSRYTLGGYHPVHLGDTSKDGRYEVHHKLGWGGYSTVWLAYDTQQQVWVALKIKTANSSDSSHELDYLQRLAKHGHLSSNYIIQLLDTFTHVGPNGSHQCLVFELLGPKPAKVLSDYPEAQKTLEAEINLRLARQVLTEIKFIHSAGICHGDISGGNIAFRASHLSHATKDEMFQALGAPECEDLVRKDGQPLDPGLPTQLIEATKWVDWIDEDEEDLRIIDFGEAFLQGEEPSQRAWRNQVHYRCQRLSLRIDSITGLTCGGPVSCVMD